MNPRSRPCVASSTSYSTSAAVAPRASATRATCSAAYPGEMPGSSPDADAVTEARRSSTAITSSADSGPGSTHPTPLRRSPTPTVATGSTSTTALQKRTRTPGRSTTTRPPHRPSTPATHRPAPAPPPARSRPKQRIRQPQHHGGHAQSADGGQSAGGPNAAQTSRDRGDQRDEQVDEPDPDERQHRAADADAVEQQVAATRVCATAHSRANWMATVVPPGHGGPMTTGAWRC